MLNLKKNLYCKVRFTVNYTYMKKIVIRNMALKEEDLSYIANNPGAAKFGNFINYYSFHSSRERINNLDHMMFPNVEKDTVFCLDIGCNTGELTTDLYLFLITIYPNINVKMLAIDIDATLIERAKERNDVCDIYFISCDIVTEKGCNLIKHYQETHNMELFDIIFCFSVTMWIHINNGDEVFINFLRYLQDNSRSLIIEPQPWKCYKNAERRMKRSGTNFELFKTLSIRNNVHKKIEEILCAKNYRKVYESPPSSWNRTIQSYHIVDN